MEENSKKPEEILGRLLRGSSKTLSVAESCTGGRISHLVVSVPGASEYYLGSVTSYSEAIKNKILGVGEDLIRDHGIVSSEVAAAMAEGVRALLGSTYSVATTGWADSYGDEWEPAGTVWIGICTPKGTKTFKIRHNYDRNRNIELFASSALQGLVEEIESEDNSV